MLISLALSAGCSGGNAARKPCPADAWIGTCKLRDLRKVEERELPIPYVVFEAIYAPQQNSRYPTFTPAEVRLRFGAKAANEFALEDQLKQQSEVACYAPTISGTCEAREVVAEVAPFDPERAATAPAPHITGCAAIDAASEQDRLQQTHTTPGVVTERFSFAKDSAELDSDAHGTAAAIAQRMSADPHLECLGLVGQINPGETLSLAEARARAVKQLLVSLGVDPKRLLTLAATANVYAAGKKPASDVELENRRVTVSVLLETQAK